MKKIFLSLFTIVCAVGSMAQNVEIYPSFTTNSQNSGITTNQTKNSVNVKAPGVTITDIQSGTDAQNGTFVTCVITPNEETVEIAALIQPAGHIEQYLDMGYPIESIFSQAEQQYQQAGMSLYQTVTPNVPFNKGFGHLTIGNEYTIHVLAFNGDGEFEYVSASVKIEVTGGGEGEASVSITINNITDSSAQAIFEINDQTAYFYLLFGTTEDLEGEGIESVQDFIDNLSVPEVNQYIQKYSSAQTGNLSELEKDVSYSIVAVAFNANEETGQGDFKTFIARKDVGLQNVNSVQITVYPNPATDRIIINSTEKIDNTELFNALGQRVYSSNNISADTVIPVGDLNKGIYILKVNANGAVQTKNIIIK